MDFAGKCPKWSFLGDESYQKNIIGLACAMAELSLSVWHRLEAVDE
jgi:hypothetical protein